MFRKLKEFFGSIRQTVRVYPVELVLIVYYFIVGILNLSLFTKGDFFERNMAYVPAVFLFALIINNLIRTGKKRMIYYLIPLLIIPVSLIDWPGILNIQEDIILYFCLLLGLACSRRTKDNIRFTGELYRYILNGLISLFFSTVLMSLLVAVVFSFELFFNISWYKTNDYLIFFSYCLVMPWLFLTFTHRNIETQPDHSRFRDIFFNYITTPALIVYNLILYGYFVKILILWELPKGGIAYMVFAFTMVAVAVRIAQPLLSKQQFSWFYRNLRFITVPAVLIFWIAVLYRLGEYGLTEMRIYLILCGVVMTIFLWFGNISKYGRLLKLFLIAICLFITFTFLPFINAGAIANFYHKHRALRLASEIGLLDRSKKIITDDRPLSDTIYSRQYSNLYSSLQYLTRNGGDMLGLEYPYDLIRMYPGVWDYGSGYRSGEFERVYLHNSTTILPLEGYSTMAEVKMWPEQDVYFFRNGNDRVTIYRGEFVGGSDYEVVTTTHKNADRIVASSTIVCEITYDEFRNVHLPSIGIDPDNIGVPDILRNKQNEILILHIDGMLMRLGSASLSVEYGILTVDGLHPDLILFN